MTRTTTNTSENMSALQCFFASQFPLLQQHIPLDIANDNAAGLSPRDALSERRRVYNAQQQRLEALFMTTPLPSSSFQKGISRWESEIPDLMSAHSSPPLQRHHYVAASVDDEEQDYPRLEEEPLFNMAVPPKIPQRRSSMEMDVDKKRGDDNITVSTAASTTGHSRESQSKVIHKSVRSQGSIDYALAPPRRSTSNVEANKLIVVTENYGDYYIPETRLQPTTTQNNTRSLDNHLKKQDTWKKVTEMSSRGSKNAPRRPRRMKSMELSDDSMTTVSMDSSSSSVGLDESNLRLVLSDSIHSVLDQVKLQNPPVSSTGKLTPTEQIILKDAVEGVVGALRRNSHSPQKSP